jgi:hypothetical protein
MGRLLSMLFGKMGSSVGAPVPEYQNWAAYPTTPVLTTDYPYQAVSFVNVSSKYLIVSTGKFYCRVDNDYTSAGVSKLYTYTAGNWSFTTNLTANSGFVQKSTIVECNADVYTDNTYTTVYKAKTI